MDAIDVTLTISAENVFRMVREIENLEAEISDLKAEVATVNKRHEDYKAKEAEREISIREAVFEECHRRTKLLELNERKNNAYREYHNKFGLALDSILKILEKRITKTDELKIKFEKEKIEKAWQEFDKVQKEVNDLANEFFKQTPGFQG